MAMLVGFPLLLIPFAIYNMFAFLMPDVAWSSEVMRLHMVSGVDWSMTLSDVLIAFAILLLFVEVLKSTRLSSRTIVDHLLSTVLFIGMLVEFLLVKQAATGTFFLLLVASFVDVVGGFTVTIRTAQRDVAIDGSFDRYHSGR
jgi:hypothetical protein